MRKRSEAYLRLTRSKSAAVVNGRPAGFLYGSVSHLFLKSELGGALHVFNRPATFWGGPATFWGGPATFWGGPATFWGGPATFWGGPATFFWVHSTKHVLNFFEPEK
jgi:hypothetical protein